MMLDVHFDGRRLNDYCTIRSVLPFVPSQDDFIEVDIEITIKDDINYNLDMLNRILYTREPKELIISDNPNRYVLASFKGPLKLSSRFSGADAKLSFVANSKYWKSLNEPKVFSSDFNSEMVVTNNGTAPTSLLIEVDFPSDSGYFSIVSPNGFLQLGDSKQMDTGTKPKTERVLLDKFDTDEAWTKITSNSHSTGLWVPDYQKLNIGSGTSHVLQSWLRFKQSTTPKEGYYWNAWGYYKNFTSKELVPAENNNWRLTSELALYDRSGTYNGTGMFLIIVMDDQNRPIVTTSVYNESNSNNNAYFSAKVNDFSGGINNKSKIIYNHEFQGGFNGMITMRKDGDEFTWEFKNKLEINSSISKPTMERFKIGDTVYIKNSASSYYHDNFSKLPILNFTRGRANKITEKRTYQGKTQFCISSGGTRVAWLFEEDLTANKSGVGNTRTESVRISKSTKSYSYRSAQLSKLIASKVVIIGGTWDKQPALNASGISNVCVDRLNSGSTFFDIDNTFNQGDRLVINNATGEILLNDTSYQGLLDYNSRFFELDYGDTELSILKSDWAQMPNVKVKVEERYR